MSEAPAQSHSSHVLTWTLGILAALLLYVLSLGPMSYINATHVLPDSWQPAIVTFYRPAALLVDYTPLGPPLNAYMDWFYNLGKPPSPWGFDVPP